MRRVVPAILACALCAALAGGCGSGGGAPASTVVFGTGLFTKARAMVYANAVNVRAADVPGFQPALHKPVSETADGPFGVAIDGCETAAARAGLRFGITSQRFVHLASPVQSVGSGVYYFKSEALAREYLSVAHSPRFSACVKTVAANGAKAGTGEGSKVAEAVFTDARLSTLPVSLPGVQAYGLRLTTRGGPGGSEAYTDFLSFVKGGAVITLTTVGQTHPFPLASEKLLLGRMYLRAQAHLL